MIKEYFETLPEFIKSDYDKQSEISQPIKILEHIVYLWRTYWASDVHIVWVPYDDDHLDNLVSIKYRIDGKLDNFIYNLWDSERNNPFSYITMEKFTDFMRWIKTAIDMEYNDTEVPQDAAYKFDHFTDDWKKESETKVRINSMPIGVDIIWKWEVWVHQSLVLRIINDSIDWLPKYDEIGIMPTDKLKLDKFLKSEKGALINSWPTGSWKSVSLQVLLSQIASEDKKIHTLEDPIEYRNHLLVQTQIKKTMWFWWAEWLRWLMRQDPDIIMVWEVRDEVSADLFIEASLTWHMWFTTTHAKTGCWAFDRLKLMWVKPYLIVWWVSISMSQRLSQKLCPDCMIKISDPLILDKMNQIMDNSFWKFDFSVLTAQDICYMIWDAKLEMIDTFNNLYKQFSVYKKKILSTSEENEKIPYKTKLIELNKQLFNSLKDHYLNNSYVRKIAQQWDNVCERCKWNWVKGRVWSFELIETTKDIEQLVLDETPLKHMEEYVRKNNVLTLDRYWIVRMMRGEIDMMELLKLL